MSDMTLLRIGIAVAMSLLLGAIIYFGRGRNASQRRGAARMDQADAGESGAASSRCMSRRRQATNCAGRTSWSRRKKPA